MVICAAGDIHGAMDRLYHDVLVFEASLGVRFEQRLNATSRSNLTCAAAIGFHEVMIPERHQAMSSIARNKAETPQNPVPLDLQQAIESLIESHPSLADPEQLRRFNEALSRQIAVRHSQNDKINKAEIRLAKRMTSIATAFSGGATAALIAAVLVPAAPGLAIVGIGLVGLLVSRYVAAAIDNLMERRTSASERSTKMR